MGASPAPYKVGGRGGGSVGAWGISFIRGPFCSTVFPGPQPREGAFQFSPLMAA